MPNLPTGGIPSILLYESSEFTANSVKHWYGDAKTRVAATRMIDSVTLPATLVHGASAARKSRTLSPLCLEQTSDEIDTQPVLVPHSTEDSPPAGMLRTCSTCFLGRDPVTSPERGNALSRMILSRSFAGRCPGYGFPGKVLAKSSLRFVSLAESLTLRPGVLLAALGDTALGDTAFGDAALGDAALGDTALGDAALRGSALGDVALRAGALEAGALGAGVLGGGVLVAGVLEAGILGESVLGGGVLVAGALGGGILGESVLGGGILGGGVLRAGVLGEEARTSALLSRIIWSISLARAVAGYSCPGNSASKAAWRFSSALETRGRGEDILLKGK